jgi:ferrochelatase
VADVRAYLREFLGDPRVLDLPWPLRRALLHGVILRLRPRRSAAAYRRIWTPAGSPLLVRARQLLAQVRKRLGEEIQVELAMRYGEPSVRGAISALRAARVDEIVVIPLFPQYAAASVGSLLDLVYREAGRGWDVPRLRVVPPFFAHPDFVEAQAELARPLIAESEPEHVLVSYHGVPERQLRRSDPTGAHCLAVRGCCDEPGAPLARCYRAQCLATSRALGEALGLAADRLTTSFQSRFGRTAWTGPHTEPTLAELARRGVRRIAVLCPSFTLDCLETLEEIGLRARERFLGRGGETFCLVPCVNASERFADALARWIRGGEDAT